MAAQKQLEEQKFNPEKFISKNHEQTLMEHNLKIQINYENGIYKPLVTPIDKNMTDAQIAENMKKAMTEIANQPTKGLANDEQAKSFNMLMAALVQNADNKTFQKIEKADQKLLAIEFKKILENSTVKIGSKSSESSTQGQETSSTDTREIWLITQKELDKILSNLEKMKAFHVTKEEAPKIVKAVQESETLTKRFTTEKNEAIGLGTGAKKNEELKKENVTGAVIIRSDPIQEEKIRSNSYQISDKYKQFKDYAIDPIKEKEKFGFYEKDGVLMVRMKHAPKKGQKEGEWKDSVLSDKDGLKAETIKDLCYVANIYKNDTETKSREKNGLNLAQAKEIRKIITDTIFSIEGVQEAFNQANKQYKKDRPGYELSRDGFAAGYLYEILKQKKNAANSPKSETKAEPQTVNNEPAQKEIKTEQKFGLSEQDKSRMGNIPMNKNITINDPETIRFINNQGGDVEKVREAAVRAAIEISKLKSEEVNWNNIIQEIGGLNINNLMAICGNFNEKGEFVMDKKGQKRYDRFFEILFSK